jgi:predicted CXXCH cytochrome family protein
MTVALRTILGCVTALLALSAASALGGGDGRIPSRQSPYIPPALPSADCTRCHPMDALFSHPVDIRPGRALPAEFPLSNGLLACATCHDVDPQHTTRAPRGSSMLRAGSDGVGFCMTCHSEGQFGPKMHRGTVGRAHLRFPDRSTSSQSLNGGLDAETRNCLSCHDGSIAPDASPQSDNPVNAQGHPVGVVYRSSGFGSHASLRPAGSVDSRVRLFDNTVGCGSCHSPYSNRPKFLVMENTGDRLCNSCHQM